MTEVIRDRAVRPDRTVGRDLAPAPRGAYAPFKRLGDVLVSAAALTLLSPLLLVIAILIRVDSPGPVFFRQRRIGRGSREFVIVKFRTMTTGTPDLASHEMAERAARYVTRVGAVLRRTSLDELPQLINVLSGEMSLVGPRPALYNQYDLIAMRQAAGVDALKPGVTGWAQINGRDDIPMDRKVGLDRHYLERCSWWMDVRVLALTPIALLTGRGAN